jgi:recombination protein RecR
MLPLAEDMLTVAHAIRRCTECGNLDMTSRCGICQDNSRDQKRLCIVEDVADLWAMERAAVFGGRYHVLGGVLSAIDGVGPDTLRLDYLVERTKTEQIEEVILALSATVDGQATAHYIADKMTGLNARITRLAHGVPVGGELDYLDDGTLAQAMKARQQF